MQYSPKLKMAMDEIKKVLQEHDIAGFIVLHTPGHVEFLNAISPSYSCAKIENGEFRVRLKTSEVGKERAKQLANDTYNMVSTMNDVILLHANGYMAFEEMLRKHWNAGPSGSSSSTSHEQQNN